MNSTDGKSAVKIAVRERPARNYLKNNLQSGFITYPTINTMVVNETVFTFDHVLGPTISQKELFDKLIKPLVLKLMSGFNCTALAYGQTGTGKSYTMGLNSKSFDNEDVGVIPRCLKEIFSMIEMNSENQEKENVANSFRKIETSASFVEIYNEKVYDLLGENTKEPICAKGYKYNGGTRKILRNLEDCQTILLQGKKNRHVRPTKMNSESSRSHAIFTIHICSRTRVNDDEYVTTSCFNIVDLAGSEGVRRTGHQGVAMSEGVHINQGLLSIGKVLQAMTSGSKVIPYRDSVLSSVLQESLNSNSYLTLLACISPHAEDISETLSTLRFAQNAKQLKITPEINTIIADIKKNAKLKQTFCKVKPMSLPNRPTPLKTSYSTFNNIQAKSAVKSHTFCTPKKKRAVINKCNRTELSSNYKKPKISNIEINLSNISQSEPIIFGRSLDSNDSLPILNISTSTAVDGHANIRKSNFSPIIRKCVAELKSGLEENILKMLQTNLHTLLPQAPAVATPLQNQTALSYTIREEVKNVMKEILTDNHKPSGTAVEVQQNQQTAFLNTSTQCSLLNNSEDELFKIPELPLKANRQKTSSPITAVEGDYAESSICFTQTFFARPTHSDKAALNKSISKLNCILENGQEISPTKSFNDSVNRTLRRSSRKSVLQRYEAKRQSLLLAIQNNQSLKMEEEGKVKSNRKASNTAKKSKRTSNAYSIINNTIIDGYCKKSTLSNTKISLAKHRKAILELLNKGSMKDLQILPQVGQKTAYQIVTQRTLIGKFKNFAQVEKLPIWRGNAWERFAQLNMLI